MTERDYRFRTKRLLIDDWHSLQADDWQQQSLASFVRQLLTPAVVAPLPPDWHGEYDLPRAQQWIEARDREGSTLLVIDVASGAPLGLVLLFEQAENELRLGYMLAESSWGQGFASELIDGLVDWGERLGIRSITGGVAFDNPASSRVLEKSGFCLQAPEPDAQEHIYTRFFS